MQNSIFDVAGPIMVGPSSSHTAGACKIGQIARALFRGTPTEVTFYLYGSFAQVYQGHATDRALLAGVMKMMTSDSNIKEAFKIAKKNKLAYEFITVEEAPDHHPNTVRIILKNAKRKLSVVGSSIGGGKVTITQINNINIDLEAVFGRFFSLLVGHNNEEDVLNPVYGKLIDWGIPITSKQTISMKKNSLTMLNIEEGYLRLPQVLELEKLPGIQFVRSLTKLLKE
ncbi:L-serine ammonia-lyase, iron-sulfur-dependent, subunit beta [Candidatus Peregrinibacteria bacterium]|nr:MAG: L-serine ammonia-lyase, iron-sulfur-dependent, subunit beta [Candidatus Peregrinibacteria bacterium]